MGKWSQYRLRGRVATPLRTEVLLWNRQVAYDEDTPVAMTNPTSTTNRVSRPIQLQTARARLTRAIIPVQVITDGGGGSVSCLVWPSSGTTPELPPVTASTPVLLSSFTGPDLVEFTFSVPHILEPGLAWYVGLIVAGAGSTAGWMQSLSTFAGGGSYTSADGSSWADAPLSGHTLPYAVYGELL